MHVRLVNSQPVPLRAERSADGITLALLRTGLDTAAVESWLVRHAPDPSPRPGPGPASEARARTASVPTLVLDLDPRVGDLARLYADLAGAPLVRARTPAAIRDALHTLPDRHSLTAVLLADRLDEPLCQAIHAANRARTEQGRTPIRYGFMTALTPAHLAWLIAKTLLLLSRPPRPAAGFASWDVAGAQGWLRRRDARSGAMTRSAAPTPWSDDRVDILSVRAHGASFDLSLGPVVLCSHQHPPLPDALTRRGPSCFQDSVCFRTAGTAPPRRVPAQDATPLLWCLDSCATVPLDGNAFGPASYASALVAGAAIGVIGPFLDIVTEGGLARVFEGVVATGGTLGDTVAAACAFEPMRGFDRFILLGSPDLRLLPETCVEPEGGLCRLRGRDQQIWRIRGTPPDERALAILGDDGADVWSTAWCDPLPDTGADWLVTLETPHDMDGGLRIGPVERSLQPVARLARRVATQLAMLNAYPFVDSGSPVLARCERWAAALQDICAVPRRVRARPDAAFALAQLHLALDTLHDEIAHGFLAQDVSLDRLAATGVDLEPTARSADRCPGCDAAVYVTRGRWHAAPADVRCWVQCPNCAGIALAPEDTPLGVRGLTARLRGDTLALRAELCNRSDGAVHAVLAGQARAGPPESRWGPERLVLDPGETRTVAFTARGLAAPGVVSYRLLVLTGGEVQIHGLRLPVERAADDLAPATPLVLHA